MSYDASEVPVAAEDLVFVAPETTYGTAVKATASHYVAVTATPTFGQPVPGIENPERSFDFGKPADIAGRPEAGEVSLACLIKPSRSLGTAPAESEDLLESGFGLETINGGTDVTYSPLAAGSLKPGVTVHWRRGPVGLMAVGVMISQMRFSAGGGNSASDLLQCEFSGQCLKILQAGKAEVTTNITMSGTTVVVANASERFQAGCFIYVDDAGTRDTATGHTISSIDYGTDTLTVTPAFASAHTAAATVTVEFYYPTGYAKSGDYIHGKASVLTWNSTQYVIKTWEANFNDASLIPNDEASGNTYPTRRFRSDRREVRISATLYMTAAQTDAWYHHFVHTYSSGSIVLDNPNGTDSVKFNFANARVEQVVPTGDSATEVTVEFVCRVSSSLNDDLQLVIEAP